LMVQIHKFCKYHDGRKKFTALIITHLIRYNVTHVSNSSKKLQPDTFHSTIADII